MVGNHAPADCAVIAFTIFYMGINAGAFFAPLVTGGLREDGYFAQPADLQAAGLRYGFATAGVGMLISYFWFLIGRRNWAGRPSAGREGWGAWISVTALAW
jgi:POT family proton-dependent oligopeptide transporter